MLKKWRVGIALIVAFCISSASLADDLAIQQDGHGVDYVTGGIGSEEVEALEAFKKQFNLYFLFSEGKIGQLVDGVDITILDAKKQTVFSLEQAAPRLLLTLPDGRYTVIASYQGNSQRYTLNAGKKHQRVILNWKNASLDDESREENRPEDNAPEEIPNDTRAELPAGS
jgi:hypothetical protein